MPGFTSEDHLKELKGLTLDPSDVIVTGYPRAGNTWLVTAIDAMFNADNLDSFADKGSQTYTMDFFQFLDIVKQLEHPRILQSHLRYDMLPDDVQKKDVKIIHISRDPRDVVVSYYHFCQIWRMFNYQGSWDTFFEAFLEGNVAFGSWFDYTKDWMSHKDDPNILFIDYEGFQADSVATIAKIANFLGKNLSTDIVEKIASEVCFDSMKQNPRLNRMDPMFFDESKGHFIRSGKVGDWKNYFTSDQQVAFDAVYQVD